MAGEANLKLYSIFTGVFVASLLLANVTSQKIFALGPFDFPGGTIVFPISFIFGDILTEVYGYALSRKVIWTGLACQILAAVTYIAVGALPPADFWHDQPAYDTVLGFVPRITSASIVAYFVGEFCNSWVLSRMKYRAGGERGLSQAWRFLASTLVGQGVDSTVFCTIAFAGVLDAGEIAHVVASIYVFKVAYETVLIPVSTRFADWVKRVEGVDAIDDPERTTYNPFALFTKDT